MGNADTHARAISGESFFAQRKHGSFIRFRRSTDQQLHVEPIHAAMTCGWAGCGLRGQDKIEILLIGIMLAAKPESWRHKLSPTVSCASDLPLADRPESRQLASRGRHISSADSPISRGAVQTNFFL
jgi:hypothetical protein